MNLFTFETNMLTQNQQEAFCRHLSASLNVREVEDGFKWDCQHDHRACRDILARFNIKKGTVDKLIDQFEAAGGFCDCEVMMNVVKQDDDVEIWF